VGVSIGTHRAYSLLEVKSIDEDARVIEGIATTPSTDRMGDIVEPKGAAFKLPIPLLWQHDGNMPIGEVFSAKVTADGIHVKARIAKSSTPGKLKDRLDEAWESMKIGLVKGLSIGFQATETAQIEGTFGVRFLKWLWLELSAVTIPANQDASILALKTADAAHLAALGNGDGSPRTTPGASGIHATAQKGARPMTIAEQIKNFEATRVAKSERMNALMSGAAEAGVTLDASQSEEYDGLEADVKGIDSHLVRLAALEKTITFKPVEKATTPAQASVARATRGDGTCARRAPPP